MRFSVVSLSHRCFQEKDVLPVGPEDVIPPPRRSRHCWDSAAGLTAVLLCSRGVISDVLSLCCPPVS